MLETRPSLNNRLVNLSWLVADNLPGSLRRRATRRVSRWQLHHRLVRHSQEFTLTTNREQQFIANDDYEAELFAWFADNLKAGDYGLDIGAHVGCFSLFMALLVGPQGRVEAVEPMPANLALLEKNIAQNGLGHVIQLHEACCAAREGGVFLNLGPSSFEASLSNDFGNGSIPVPALTIDGLALKNGRLDFVKLDVEGAELDVLQGAETALAKFRPKLVVELHPPMAAEVPIFMQNKGYRAFALDGKELWPGDLVLRAGNQEERPFHVVFLPA
jgi:FkbM family methyltransferase